MYLQATIDEADALDAPTERWGVAGANGVGRTLPPPPGAVREASRYADCALLGVGGMGDVFACEDRRIGRIVARKTMRVARGDTDATTRFIDEARLQGRLEHPAIVPVYDLETDEGGTPFFTMKRVRGRTLAEVLAARGTQGASEWSTRRLLGALSTVALAIDYAHGQGVVHGDLKPQNVMLGRFGEVHVLDWGCAAEAREDLGPWDAGSDVVDVRALASLCRDGGGEDRIVGTPGYLAPEQARGMRGVPASDVYALGAILFEILAGEPLHRGATPLALLVCALAGERQRPSQRVPGLVVPRGLEDLVERALDPDPALRPTVRELAAGIEAILDHEASELVARRTAERHAAEANEHARRALESGDERSRTRALRDAGRAVALDPDNRAATDVLARLLVQPPSELPPEAHAEVAETERQFVSAMIAAMGTRTRMWLAMTPLAVALGVRALPASVATIVVIVIAAIVFERARHAHEISQLRRLGLLAVALLAVSSFGGVFGPFVLVPGFAVTTATMLAVGLDRTQRVVATALTLASVFVPLGLELAGMLPPSMTISENAITLHPRLVGFPPALTLTLLVVGNAMAVPICITLMGRAWDEIDRARRRLALRTWQLERALPKRGESA